MASQAMPSVKLLPLLLEDAFKLSISRDHTLVERYLSRIEQQIVALPYKQWFTLIDTPEQKLKICLQRAGHILGSAYIEIDVSHPSQMLAPSPMLAPSQMWEPAPRAIIRELAL